MSTQVHAPAQARTNASPAPQKGTLTHATREHETAQPVPESICEVVRTGGQPLDPGMQKTMGAQFGHDFSKIRIHTDEQAAASARAIRANAYTLGNNIAFANDMYAPHTSKGQALLAHELTHIVQSAHHQSIAPIIAPAHHAAEQEATDAAHHISRTPSAAPGGLVQRQSSDLLETGKEAVSKAIDIQKAEFLAQAALVVGFLEGARANIPLEDFEALKQELSQAANAVAFVAGEQAGILVGAIKDLIGTIGGLLEMAVKLSAPYQIGSELYSLYRQGPRGYWQEKQQNYEKLKALKTGLQEFVQGVIHDPNVLIQIGGELGIEAGKYSAKWFTGKFMKMSPFGKGETVGEVMGYILLEIALLFVGPEELAIRGGALAAKAAEGTKLGRAILAALEKIPALAKILEARKLVGAGREAANIAEKGVNIGEKGLVGAEKAAAEASHLAPDVGKGTAKIEDATHAATSAEQKAVKRPPGVDEATHQQVERGFAESDTPDTSGPYQTTQRLARGNLGERAATEALARDGHQILHYKPEITGTNQGGIDMVTMRNGIVYLVDNKALSKGGNVSSVSALTTNFTRIWPLSSVILQQ